MSPTLFIFLRHFSKKILYTHLFWICISAIFMDCTLYAQTAIGGLTPHSSAMLDVQSDSKGILFPRLTAQARDAIASPATGLVIFNTDNNCMEINLGVNSPKWQKVVCPGTVAALNCSAVTTSGGLIPGTQASNVSFSIPYTGGNGFPYDGQQINSSGITGFTATIEANNFANGSGTLTFSVEGISSTRGDAIFEVSIGGQTCNVTVPVGCGAYIDVGVWKTFSCYNLGVANDQADPFTPSWEINGGYYQWGSPTESAPGPTGPDADPLIANSGEITGWVGRYEQPLIPGDAWLEGFKTPNDPCPPGYRVPTESEWNGVGFYNDVEVIGTTWTTDSPYNYGTGFKFGPALYLPAAGSRDPTAEFNGIQRFRGQSGDYWTSRSTFSSDEAGRFVFQDNGFTYFSFVADDIRNAGLSVRCIKE